MELTSNAVIAIIVSLTVGVSAAVPLALMLDENEPFPGPQSKGASEASVVVTILELQELGDLDIGPPDFYAKVVIDGISDTNMQYNEFWEDKAHIWPGWEFDRKVDMSQGSIPIEIVIWDENWGYDDTHADIKPGSGRDLALTLDFSTCTITGDGLGAPVDCGISTEVIGDGGDEDDDVKIGFRIEVLTSVIGVRLTIVRVTELGDLDYGEPDFYAAVTIDKSVLDNKQAARPWDDDKDIWPGWEFMRWVNASLTSVPIKIQIWDEDDGRADDHTDIKPDWVGPGSDLYLTVTLDPCYVSGPPDHNCGIVFEVNGDGGDEDDDVRIWYKIDVVEPPSAPDLYVKCYHYPIWPKEGEEVRLVARVFNGSMLPLEADMVEIWVNYETTPSYSLANSFAKVVHDAGPFSPPTFSYRCRAVHEGKVANSDWRVVSVGDPPNSRAIPVLWTGFRGSTIDIVFIADKDSYPGGAHDKDFIEDVYDVIVNAYYVYPVFLSHQDKMGFWIADRTGDAKSKDDDWDHDPPDNWDDDYTFADVGAILHTDSFQDAARPDDRVFSTEPYSHGTVLHESGHVPFGLADEYPLHGAYFELDTHANVFDEREGCENDAPELRRQPSDCREIIEERTALPDRHWYTSEPPNLDDVGGNDDLMDDNGPPQAADIRRIDWIFRQCDSARCQEIEHPHSEPIMPVGSAGPSPTGTYPGLEAVPTPESDDPGKSIAVHLDFNSQTDVTLDSISVSMHGAHANIGDPPLLDLQLFDDTGAFIGKTNAWNPLWIFAENADGTHRRIILPSGNGRFIIPFYDDYGVMKVRDIPLNQELIEVDLKPVIREFCWQNPTDRDCMANFTWSAPVEEGGAVQFTDLSVGPGTDIVSWRWDFGDGTPRSTDQNPTHVYGDNGIFTVTLRVRNSDGLKDSVKYSIIVGNVDPSIDPDVSVYTKADITLRVAGEKWHDVRLTLTEDAASVNSVSLTRYPGSPVDQAVTVASQSLNILGGPTLGAVVEYTPDDDPVNGQPNGANPVWITLTMENGNEFQIQHTFNVNHPGTYVWTIEDILDYVSLVNVPLYFYATAIDPGSDDLEFRWEWDDGTPDDVATYLNDPRTGPDPFPSPELNPRDVTDHQVHTYINPGTYMIALTVTDDDKGTDTITITIVI